MRWTGQQAIVTLPQHMDESNAGQIREELLLVINRGADGHRPVSGPAVGRVVPPARQRERRSRITDPGSLVHPSRMPWPRPSPVSA